MHAAAGDLSSSGSGDVHSIGADGVRSLLGEVLQNGFDFHADLKTEPHLLLLDPQWYESCATTADE